MSDKKKKKPFNIKDCFTEFELKKDNIFKRNQLYSKIYSVEFKILYSGLISLNKELANLQKRKPGPLTVFTFIEENYLLLRFEFFCVILEKSIANQFQLFTDTDYLPIKRNEIGMLNQLYSSLNLEEKDDQYFELLNEDYSNNQLYDSNKFFRLTYGPLFWYMIKRFDYPKEKFQDSLFFEYNFDANPNIKKILFLNKKKKIHGPIELKINDFYSLHTEQNCQCRCIYIPTMKIFYKKSFVSENEINFFKQNDFWLFVKCVGYCYEESSASKVLHLIYEYMPNNRFSKFSDKTSNYDRLITFFRIAYCFDNLHSNGYIYRSLKESKILFDKEGFAYLSSFKYYWNVNQENEGDIEVGPPLYAAPEQEEGKHYMESDVYSFGRFTLRLFNGKLNKNDNELDQDFGYLNFIVEKCLKKEIKERPTMKFIISQISRIINNFPVSEEDKQRARDYNKYLMYGSRKFIDGRTLVNSKDKFLSQLYDINFYKIESIETDYNIMDSLFKNSFTPFVTLDIQKINGSDYLIIGFELSCLCVKISILKENDNFYLNKLSKVIDSNVSIYPVSKKEFSLFDNSNIIYDEIFFEMIENCLSLSNDRISKNSEVSQKIFPSLIGYSIKRFYFTEDQFNDPYFFNYEEFQKGLKENKINSNDIYLLKNFDTNRYIVYNLTHQQLFMIISNFAEYSMSAILKDDINNPCLIKYIGYKTKEHNYYHFFEFVGDYSLNDYLNQESAILKDPTFRTKIIVDILFCYYKLDQLMNNPDCFISTRYIFLKQSNNSVKIAFPVPFGYIKRSMMNIGLILLSLYFCGKYNDLSFQMIGDINEIICQRIINECLFHVSKNDFPFHYLVYLCFNYEKEIDTKNVGLDNFYPDLIRLIYKYGEIFPSTNQSVIIKECEMLAKNNNKILNENLLQISMKSNAEDFFKSSSLHNIIKEFNVYHLHKGEKIFFIREILQNTKFPPLATFYLGNINNTTKFILVYNKTIIIYYMHDIEAFANDFLINWENKNLYAIDSKSLDNFKEKFSSICQDINLSIDEKLASNALEISSDFYHQTSSYVLKHKAFQVLILYLLKRFEFNSNEFEDPSFFDAPFNTFTEFNQNDFIMLFLVGSGSTSNINVALHKQTLRLFAIKSFSPLFNDIFEREIQIYSSNFNNFCPFITKCYGYIRNSTKLVFEYMSRGSLNQIREKKLINETINTKVMLRILSAFVYLHSINMVYKDLKPENILFDHNFEPFLTDLGAVTSSDELTHSFGNLLFAAPEFLAKEDTDYPNKIDVYSFGRLLYYMCSENENLSLQPNKTNAILPHKYNVFQDIYIHCTQEEPELRPNSTDLLFDLIYYERFFPETKKEEIKPLIKLIIENCFENKDIYKPFFYTRGISFNNNIEYSNELEEEIKKNDYLLFELGNLYFYEFNDKSKAIKLYKEAEKRGIDKATNWLGILYFKGEYFKKDIQKSIEIFKSIKMKNSDALNNYGYALLFGLKNPLKTDIEEAIKAFREAIKKFNKKESYVNLGDLFCGNYESKYHISIAKDINKAINYYFGASKMYYDIPFTKLALLSIKENGTIDSKDANYYFKKALFINKNPEIYKIIYYSQASNVRFKCDDDLFCECLLNLKKYFQLGVLLYEQNKIEEAKKQFILESIESNNSHSQNYLGIIYFNEEIKNGYLTKYSQSLKYFKKAAKNKFNYISQYNLGLIYYKYSNNEIKSIRKSIHFFKMSSVKGHFKAKFYLGQIYENCHNFEKAAYYYEDALRINDKCAYIYNKLGVFHSIGKGVNLSFAKAKEYFNKASEMNFLLARNNYAVLLMNFSKREYDIKEAYGVFYGLHRDHKFVLASCNLGFLYVNRNRLFDSITFFMEALKNFKEQFLEKNVLFENKEEQECLNITVFYVYLIVLHYYLEDDFWMNSKSLFNLYLNDLLIFYSKFKKLRSYISKELYFKYDVDETRRIIDYLDFYSSIKNKQNEEIQFDFGMKTDFSHILKELIQILQKEISENNFEILFCSRKKPKNLGKIEYTFNKNLSIKPEKNIYSIIDLIDKIINEKSNKYDIKSPIYLKFNHLFPNEIALNEIYSNFDFIFIQKLDSKIEEIICELTRDSKFAVINIDAQKIITILANNHFFYFLTNNENKVLELFHNIPQIYRYDSYKIIGNDYEQYSIFIDNLLFDKKNPLKNYIINQISIYSLLFYRFNSCFDVLNERKCDSLDLVKLRKIKDNVYKVINIKTNSVFLLKEVQNKKQKKNEIQFYNNHIIFQVKMIVPRLLSRVENENSLLFEYIDNFSEFVDKNWNSIDDTIKSKIFIKIIFLINYVHSNGFALCGLQLDSFLIKDRGENNYDLYIDDLYHFLDIDYEVPLNSEFISPEIKKFNQNLNLPISYHSDIFSIGKIATKLGHNISNSILNNCLFEDPFYRPNSLFLLINMYCHESYFENADNESVNFFIECSVDKKLFGNLNRRCDIQELIDNNDRLQNIKTSLENNDFDVLIAILHAKIQGYFMELDNKKIRYFFSSDDSFAEFLEIANNF